MVALVAQCLHFSRHFVRALVGYLRQSLLESMKASQRLANQC